MNKFLQILVFALVVFTIQSCSSTDTKQENVPVQQDFFMKGCDISLLPKLREKNIALKNENNQTEDLLQTLKRNGVNLVRIRLWKNPSVGDSNTNFTTVKNLTTECKNLGFKVLLTVHYSDTWADPANQAIPLEWSNLSFSQLQTEVTNYTKDIIQQINPDFIQIGNEINNGLMWPQGNFSNLNNFKSLLQSAINGVRQTNSQTKIVLHYAGHEDAVLFFNNFTNLDFDYIGLSYYPNWHGKDLNTLKSNLQNVAQTFNKKVFIAETAYPFTFQWNDMTNNIIGSQSQILTAYSATNDGQKQYLQKIKEITSQTQNCIGFCYWGGEWVSYDGPQSTFGSPWENQALWDFNNKVLPVIEVFR